ncbi:MAG: acyl-CoA dehydratase activase-related protein [Flaviflexus sp.]|uniref:acyl-CoA dehydratase activase-related protein n=1 Tax=Flaviflexus sp. TaxID=1969482 RepID=UPI003F8FB37B
MTIPLKLGIDVGSTTVKAVVWDGARTIFDDYRRHNADVRAELAKLLQDVSRQLGDVEVQPAFTGSGGMQLADQLDVSFVQEVIGQTEVTRQLHPETDVIIELGGEDAKLTYLHPTPEQRMNGTCAGGTGAFIDQMASLLATDAAGLNALAADYTELYPIASRCGVFAKTDVQPLLNQGVPHEDIAASVFQAVALQTVAGLAAGRPIRGSVMLLGGPLHFMPELRQAFSRVLDKADEFVAPENAQLYVAMGAALLADGRTTRLNDLLDEMLTLDTTALSSNRMRALFADEREKTEFDRRHAASIIPTKDITEARGACYLGVDAGSTTIKAVLIDEDDSIVFTHYASNEGDPVAAAVDIVRRIQTELPPGLSINRSCSTGYGEGLVKTALGLDDGEIETMAHFRAANHMMPGVDSVIDIGGQDMKYLTIKEGVVDSISVNEACSSGCGSFLQTFAHTMGQSVEGFAQAATEAKSPVDLGTRCTVFMNSSVKSAQKEGACVSDISAGLSYSVVRNALFKVINLKSPEDLGEKVVVQGGTFLNDSVLRAFELLTKREVVRPNLAGLMGAYGAALTAKMNDDGSPGPHVLPLEELDTLTVETSTKVCRLCQNHCKMTISDFSSGQRHVSGNRCARGASLEKRPPKSPIPNMFDWKYKRTFGYRRLTEAKAFRGDIGVPRVLGLYENYPFWFTVLTSLGFRVMLSGRSSHNLFEDGMESIPSENVCYPAKLAHGHIESLLDKGLKTIFYPCVSYEKDTSIGQDNTFNCPIVATYPEVLRNNMERLAGDDVNFISPFVSLADRELLPKRVTETFADFGVTEEEARKACDAGWDEDDAYRQDILDKGRESLDYIAQHNLRGIVLAGRPYHLDPEINHGTPDVIIGLGMAVLTEDAVPFDSLERPLRVRDQWAYHSRLYEAAATVGTAPDLQLVQLTSFGCGLDAVTSDQVIEILEEENDVYTGLKIDEISNLGAARIRLRSLAAAADERMESTSISTRPESGGDQDTAAKAAEKYPKVEFTKQMREDYTILAPQMAPIHFRFLAPALRRAGYNVKLLEHASNDNIETGLTFVHNDACYPAIVVIGQLISQFTEGREDPDSTAVMITQTGGMCRATNYAAILRKGLADAGYPQVPVIAASAQGIEENSGFELTLPLIHRAFQAVTIGDVLQKVLLRTRPYEIDGNATALYEYWDQIGREFFETGYSTTLGRRTTFTKLIKEIVAEFDVLPLQDIPRKPRVGIVGEILVQYHPDANNNAVGTVEAEGCEAELPSLAQFFQNALATAQWKHDNLGNLTQKQANLHKAGLWVMQQYEKTARKALEGSERFDAGATIQELREKAQDIVSLGNQAGEGWYLVADMMDMIERGCSNIICAQPFACLPNHVVGRGMFRALRNKYDNANIVSIDYDAGASPVNQLNRIKLMISTAFLGHESELDEVEEATDSKVSLGMPRLRIGART